MTNELSPLSQTVADVLTDIWGTENYQDSVTSRVTELVSRWSGHAKYHMTRIDPNIELIGLSENGCLRKRGTIQVQPGFIHCPHGDTTIELVNAHTECGPISALKLNHYGKTIEQVHPSAALMFPDGIFHTYCVPVPEKVDALKEFSTWYRNNPHHEHSCKAKKPNGSTYIGVGLPNEVNLYTWETTHSLKGIADQPPANVFTLYCPSYDTVRFVPEDNNHHTTIITTTGPTSSFTYVDGRKQEPKLWQTQAQTGEVIETCDTPNALWVFGTQSTIRLNKADGTQEKREPLSECMLNRLVDSKMDWASGLMVTEDLALTHLLTQERFEPQLFDVREGVVGRTGAGIITEEEDGVRRVLITNLPREAVPAYMAKPEKCPESSCIIL